MVEEGKRERIKDVILDEISDLITKRFQLRDSFLRVQRHRVIYQSPREANEVLLDYDLTDSTRDQIKELIKMDVQKKISDIDEKLLEKGVRF